VKKAAAEAAARREALLEKREQLQSELQRMREKMGDGGTEEERSLLERKQRELDRLDRDLQGQQGASRQLDRLDRDLQQAAEDLAKDLGAGASDLDQGAEDLNRLDQDKMSQEEKEQLRQKLEEMKQLVRQQGVSKAQLARLRRFGQAARGRSGEGGQGEGQGQSQGQGDKGNGGEQQQQGQGQGQGKGGQSGQGMELESIGPGGSQMLILSKGRGSSGTGDEGGEGDPSRKNWGDQHDPRLMGKATAPSMGTQDTQLGGGDADRGASRSQVIQGAAQRGFASKAYGRVYGEYQAVAEESLAKEEIPAGYRSYVKRYFELIRPRD
jgi:hypothetical protein